MANYSLLIKQSAAKELEELALKHRRRIVAKLRALSTRPRPSGCEKLGVHNLYRVRQGNYRVVYEILDEERRVTIIKIGHRRDVYR